MHLVVDGARLKLAQLGPDFLILAEPAACRQQHAEIALEVDAIEERWKIDLPDGLAAAGQRTRIVNRT